MTKDFDVVVIGGGPAGISGATTAGVFGKRVALVEKLHDVGGAGINTGTIPSKTYAKLHWRFPVSLEIVHHLRKARDPATD